MSASTNASNCAKKKKKRLTHKLSSKIQKEVQNLILAPAFDEVYKSKVMSDEDKKTSLYRKYHGNPLDQDYVSLVDQFLQGVGPFRGLFDQEEVLNNEPGNTGRIGSGRLVLKDCLTQDSSKKYVVGIHLTRDVLVSKSLLNKSAFQKVSMWNRAKEVVKEAKKAIAYGKDVMTAQGALKSGLQEEDFDSHVLSKMFLHYNATGEDPTNTVEDDDGRDEDDDDTTSTNEDGDGRAIKKSTANDVECPKHWTFTGWMAFKAYGLFPLAGHCNLHIFKEGDDDIISKADQIKSGRAAARKEDREAKNKLRENAIAAGSSDELRGLSLQNQLQFAGLAERSAAAEERVKENKITTFILQMDQQSKKVGSFVLSWSCSLFCWQSLTFCCLPSFTGNYLFKKSRVTWQGRRNEQAFHTTI
jgi:hypothetical protein